MSAPYEQPGPILSDEDLPPSELLVYEKPERPEHEVGLLEQEIGLLKIDPADEPSLGGINVGSAVGSREELQAAAYEAYGQATARRLARPEDAPLDEGTVGLYRKAAEDLLTAEVWRGMGDRPRNPFNMLTRAACLGWQAEGTPPGEFYDRPHRHINVKTDLQTLADKELEDANAILLGENDTVKELLGQMEELDETFVAKAAVKAAKKSGTGEHVMVRGVGGIDEATSERLEAGGQEALARYTGEHALEARHGGKFTALMAEEEATAVHAIPAAPDSAHDFQQLVGVGG